MLSNMHLRVQMDAKSGQLKNESESEMFRAPSDAQEIASGTLMLDVCLMVNAFALRLMVQFRVT